ncbi:MAG: hypothetical protein ABJZ55_18615 [Fuerstiella sp.]
MRVFHIKLAETRRIAFASLVRRLFLYAIPALSLFVLSSALADKTKTRPQDAPGGFRNPWPALYNKEWAGKGSKGQVIYNKLLIPGKTMRIQETWLYDNQGNPMAKTQASSVGYVAGERDGGINAGCITNLLIDGVKTECVLMFAIDIQRGSGISGEGKKERGGGRRSGWAPLESLEPRDELLKIQHTIKSRIDKIRPNQRQGNVKEYTVIDYSLPEEAAEWYVTPGRSAKKSQGKAKYYFTRRGRLYGLINIPESGKQRFGVTYDVAPVGAKFYRDMAEPEVKVPIYAPDSTKPSQYTLPLVYGAFINNAGEKRFCWTNSDCLKD